MAKKHDKRILVSFFLRAGLAFVFFYAGIASLLFPQNWIGFFPSFLRVSWILILFSVFEIILGFWLLSNKRVFYASLVSAIGLFFIIIFNLTLFDLVFRDVGLFFIAIALAILSHKT